MSQNDVAKYKSPQILELLLYNSDTKPVCNQVHVILPLN